MVGDRHPPVDPTFDDDRLGRAEVAGDDDAASDAGELGRRLELGMKRHVAGERRPRLVALHPDILHRVDDGVERRARPHRLRRERIVRPIVPANIDRLSLCRQQLLGDLGFVL